MKKILTALLALAMVFSVVLPSMAATGKLVAKPALYISIPDEQLYTVLTEQYDVTGVNGNVLVSDMADLEKLDLHDCGITDLRGLQACEDLEWLDLSGNGVKDIAVLTALEELEYLNLSGNDVTGVYVISVWKELTELVLNEDETVNVSEYGESNMFQSLYRYYVDYRKSPAMKLLMGDKWIGLIDNSQVDVYDLKFMETSEWMEVLEFAFRPETITDWESLKEAMLFDLYVTCDAVTAAEVQRWLLTLGISDDKEDNEVDKMALFIWLTYNQGIRLLTEQEEEPEKEPVKEEKPAEKPEQKPAQEPAKEPSKETETAASNAMFWINMAQQVQNGGMSLTQLNEIISKLGDDDPMVGYLLPMLQQYYNNSNAAQQRPVTQNVSMYVNSQQKLTQDSLINVPVWASQNSSVVAVDQNGVLTSSGNLGQATVTCTDAVSNLKQTFVVTVKQNVASSFRVSVGQTLALGQLTGLNYGYQWSTSNTSVLQFSGPATGLAVGMQAGVATVTAVNSYFPMMRYSFTVQVETASLQTVDVPANANSLNFYDYVARYLTFVPTTYTSNDSRVIRFVSNGVAATGVSGQIGTVTVSGPMGERVVFTVRTAGSAVSVTGGATVIAPASAMAGSSFTVTYSISKSYIDAMGSVPSVTFAGMVNGTPIGTSFAYNAPVRVDNNSVALTVSGENYVATATYYVNATVEEPVQISVSGGIPGTNGYQNAALAYVFVLPEAVTNDIALLEGATSQLYLPGYTGHIRWETSDANVAQLNAGLGNPIFVGAKSAGTATVRAYYGATLVGTYNITVTSVQ